MLNDTEKWIYSAIKWLNANKYLTFISMVDFTYESYTARKVYIMFSNLVVMSR